jgi:drug/metabolite transporter (DMT)-like permease
MYLLILIWGVNFTVIKSALDDFPPFVFTVVRYGGAAVLLILALRLLEPRGSAGVSAVSRRDLPALVGLGLLGHSGYQMFFITGLARTTAGNASLILSMAPIFVGILSVALGLERPSPRMWIGLVVAFLGLLALVAGRGGLALGLATLTGDILVLISTACWAAYTVFSRPMLGRVTPLWLTTVTLLLGLPPLFAAGVPELAHMQWAAVRAASWGAMAFSSIFAVALSYVIWSRSVSVVGGVRTAALGNLIPVVALVTARIVLGEPLGPLQIIGGAVVLTGVWLSSPRAAPYV